LALGSTPSQLLTKVLREGAVIILVGITAGVVFGFVLARVASAYLGTTRMQGLIPAIGAAAVLIGAAMIASLIPAARASRVNVLEALRSE
jgi:putative ABC transport system permease protein